MILSRNIAVAIASVILLGSGLLCYALAQDSAQLDAAVLRLQNVPMEVGAWKATPIPEEQGDERAYLQAGAKGHWVRSYVHPRTKASVLVILMCGRAGKMAVHTPEVCYRGAGFELNDQSAVCSLKNDQNEKLGQFWTAQFSKRTTTTTHLRLYWAWNAGQGWEASAHPRWEYQGAPYLYKLYVSRDLAGGVLSPQADPAADFLRLFVPLLQSSLAQES